MREQSTAVVINKNVLGSKKVLFMGLSAREFVCATLGLGLTSGTYFLIHQNRSSEQCSVRLGGFSGRSNPIFIWVF